jgi:hypothetical protein
MEYQRLKEILAKKEKENSLKEKKKQQTLNKLNRDTTEENSTNSKKIVEDENCEKHEDDESALRLQLLQNMKTSLEKKKVALNSQMKGEDKSASVPMNKNNEICQRDKITVMLSGETRNVEVNGEKSENFEKTEEEEKEVESKELELKEGVDQTKLKLLEDVESGVVRMRKTLSTSLFKLSAYMSQLQKETIGVEKGLKYVEELKRQLRETEELVTMRQEKVDNLREVIRESHKQITLQRQDMTSKEDECRNIGMEVHDGEYKPPADGAENIRKKLEMIRNTALKVKTTSYSTTPGATSTGSIVGGSVGCQADYVSPLEHLNQSERFDTVKLDHTKELCRFELAGKCLDEACQFQHCS